MKNKLTFDELVELMELNDVSAYEVIEDHYDFSELMDEDENVIGDVVGEIQIAFEDSDYSDGKDNREKVLWFKDHDIYVKFTGYYQSFVGLEWNDTWTEVKPKKVETIVYE